MQAQLPASPSPEGCCHPAQLSLGVSSGAGVIQRVPGKGLLDWARAAAARGNMLGLRLQGRAGLRTELSVPCPCTTALLSGAAAGRMEDKPGVRPGLGQSP